MRWLACTWMSCCLNILLYSFIAAYENLEKGGILWLISYREQYEKVNGKVWKFAEVAGHIKNQYLMDFFNIKPISHILGMTSEFNCPIISSYWILTSRLYSNNWFIKCNLEGYASLGLTVTETGNLKRV